MSTGNFKISPGQSPCVCCANKPAPVSNEVMWSNITKPCIQNSMKICPWERTGQLTASLCEEQKLIHRTTTTAECLTEAKKLFSDSEIAKDCFLASAETLFTDFDNKNAIIKQITIV